jgi:hypothetical protein
LEVTIVYKPTESSGSCNCGAARFSISGKPLVRFFCHCTICQEFNKADYADVTAFFAKDVVLDRKESVEFRVYQQPPLLKRGKCVSCGRPAVEGLTIPLFPRLTVVPSGNIEESASLPDPAFHMFYHRRKADMADRLPKHSGYFNSQFWLVAGLMRAMLRDERHGS